MADQLQDARIDQLPDSAGPKPSYFIAMQNMDNNVTERLPLSYLLASGTSINIEWVTDNGDGYMTDELVTYEGNIYGSLVDNNLNVVPGTDPSKWELLTRSASGFVFHQNGVFMEDEVFVLNTLVGYVQLFRLVDDARPYVSSDFYKELADGDWDLMSETGYLGIYKAGHGFTTGKALTFTGAGWILNTGSDSTLAIVKQVVDADRFIVALTGPRVKSFTGLTAGSKYYRQADGTISTVVSDYPVFIAISTTEVILLASGGGGSGSQNLEDVLTEGNDGGGIEIENIADPTSPQSADTQAARDAAIAAAVSILLGGVPAAGDTLAKLYTLITAMGRPRGPWDASGNTVPGSASNEDGDFWRISVGGTLAGLAYGSGVVSPGDIIIAIGDGATAEGSFYAIQSNVDQATASVLGLVKLYVNLSASNVDGSVTQAALVTAFGLKADLASPTFTGTPAAPTPTYNDNTTKIATMAALQEAKRKTYDMGNLGATPTIDFSQGQHIIGTRNAQITSMNWSNLIAGEVYTLTLIATADFTAPAITYTANRWGSGNGNLPPVTQPIANGYASVEDIFTVWLSPISGKAVIVATQNIRYN